MGRPVGWWVRVPMGMGMGSGPNTWGLPLLIPKVHSSTLVVPQFVYCNSTIQFCPVLFITYTLTSLSITPILCLSEIKGQPF
jgi:hypothetical protein